MTLKIFIVLLMTLNTSAYGNVEVQKDYSTRQGIEMAGSLSGGLITGLNVYTTTDGRPSKRIASIGIGSGLLLIGAAFSSEAQYPIVLALSGTAAIASGVFSWKNLQVLPAIIPNDDHKSLLGLHVSFRFSNE